MQDLGNRKLQHTDLSDSNQALHPEARVLAANLPGATFQRES